MTTYTFSELFTFTRSTTATFVGSNGLIQTAAINAPRFDYDPVTLAPKGILIEEQRVNLQTYSEELDNAAWVKSGVTVSANAAVAPTGATTADKVIPTAVASAFKEVQRSFSSVSGTTYTYSVYVKADGYQFIQLVGTNGEFGNFAINFDLSNGTETAFTAGTSTVLARGITPVGNGYYRVFLAITAIGTNAGARLSTDIIPASNSARGVTWTGDGTSGILQWGVQVEAGAFATSYIPTVASQVTRAADVCAITAPMFAPWYSQPQGTMVCNFVLEGQTAGGAVSDVWVVNNSGSTANATRLREGTVVAGADVTMLTGGAVQVDSNSFSSPANTLMKSAFAWSTTSSNLTANGVSLGDGGAITPPTVNQLVLTGGSKWLQQVDFYPVRLSNTQLQAITA